jgi:hypothetical protein
MRCADLGGRSIAYFMANFGRGRTSAAASDREMGRGWPGSAAGQDRGIGRLKGKASGTGSPAVWDRS